MEGLLVTAVFALIIWNIVYTMRCNDVFGEQQKDLDYLKKENHSHEVHLFYFESLLAQICNLPTIADVLKANLQEGGMYQRRSPFIYTSPRPKGWRARLLEIKFNEKRALWMVVLQSEIHDEEKPVEMSVHSFVACYEPRR